MAADNGAGSPLSARAEAWASTMAGFAGGASSVRHAHGDTSTKIGLVSPLSRTEREAREASDLAPGATRAVGAGVRARAEEPDLLRTCFERDRDRILHA